MTVYEQLAEVCSESDGQILTTAQIKSLLAERFGTNPSSVLPSDYCYNRWNQGIQLRNPVLIRVGSAEYRCAGPHYPYTGLVFWRPKGASEDQVVGEWVNGQLRMYIDDPKSQVEPPAAHADQAGAPAEAITIPLSREQLNRLYEEYMEILTLEIGAFGCKPTETRHLIGRLGEFYCARITGGQLARRVNQEGFDVVSSTGRRISVKTTAQGSGFISMNANTVDRADDLMILRYDDGAFEIVYHGQMQPAADVARPYQGRLELDLTKARKLAAKQKWRGVEVETEPSR